MPSDTPKATVWLCDRPECTDEAVATGYDIRGTYRHRCERHATHLRDRNPPLPAYDPGEDHDYE